MSSRSRRLLALAVACAAIASFTAAPRPPEAPSSRVVRVGGSYPDEALYSLALHMHGSMSEQSGSWEWHTAKAESAGVDIIWWTDHDWRLTSVRSMRRYDFESAFWDAPWQRWKEPDEAIAGEYRYWEVGSGGGGFLQTSVVDTLAFGGTKSFRLAATGDPGSTFRAAYATQTCSDFQNHHSLAKHMRLRFRVWPEQLDAADARLVFEVELSDHPTVTPTLRYVLGSMDGEDPASIPLGYVPGQWNEYLVDVTEDAIARFSTGGADSLRVLDNCVAFVRLGLECRNASHAVVFFDEYRMEPDAAREGPPMVDAARSIAGYYETVYPAVKHFVGTEISLFRAQPHLNGYAPNLQLVNYTGHVWSDTLHYAIDQIHAQGGAVSLNHLFGPQFWYENDPNETPQHRDDRRTYTKRVYIGNRALGVDVLEAGYRRRGGCELVHHLDLWDALNANMVFLTGNGVTDSHGRGPYQLDGWGPSEAGLAWVNNFVTWMYTEDLSEAGFVRSMKSGRAFFGDPWRWKGALDLRTLDGFRMGQVVRTDAAAHDVTVEVTSVPGDVRVRFVQVEMRDDAWPTYLNPVFLRDEILSGDVDGGVFRDTVTVTTSTPSFVRVEVQDGSGQEMVFSNPLYFAPVMPTRGIPAERAAARLGPVRLFRAENLTLTQASWDEGQQMLGLGCDERTPGLGVIRLEPGTLGPPHAVWGAGAWTWLGGVLELSGFAGTGSTVTVSWGATDAPSGTSAAAPSVLDLRLAGPNPTAATVGVEFSLPREGWTRLEVLDVAGRRVRDLVTGFRSGGRQRVDWDGRDDAGSPVAAGVYWIRLEHDGDTLRQKVVRLR